jgi:hypothetical protein
MTKQSHTPDAHLRKDFQGICRSQAHTILDLQQQRDKLVAALREFRTAYLVPKDAADHDFDRNHALMTANQVASAVLAEIESNQE